MIRPYISPPQKNPLFNLCVYFCLYIRVEEYIRQTFENTNVKIEVVKGQTIFEKEYPCLAAVNRCATSVPRHDGRVIWLTYEPEGTIEKTITY